jgi:peptide deformylase
MVVREILLLGNPKLHEISAEVMEDEVDGLRSVVQDLHDTLIEFRKKYGVGRAIAAPQIGVLKRLVYMHIDAPLVFINPQIKETSKEMIELWDDCMSFPDLFVRVARHKSCKIVYRDLEWNERTLLFEDDLSELLQHEIDHLDGILAVSRAIGNKSFSLRSQFGYHGES